MVALGGGTRGGTIGWWHWMVVPEVVQLGGGTRGVTALVLATLGTGDCNGCGRHLGWCRGQAPPDEFIRTIRIDDF